jgi:predicted RND superfamily exporter protein
VGVDYGIYLYERMKTELANGMDLPDAFASALRQRGSAALFTAVTMAIGVGTWAFSALKFQADMGILLAFMFLVNMLGAVSLLPALATVLLPPVVKPQGNADGEPQSPSDAGARQSV